jgi:prepilin-type N-terminal cleavage/methylation domain-containing protein
MGKQKNKGFTIIELSMVLAISSLLLVLMMTGITLAVQRQRFSDSVNGTQSFLQEQFNLTQNTVNDRTTSVCGDPNNPGVTTDTSVAGSSKCIVLGKFIDFIPGTATIESSIRSYDVVGTNVDPDDPMYINKSDLALLNAINPTVIQQTEAGNYTVPWGAGLHDPRDATNISNGQVATAWAILRSPRNGLLHVYKVAIGMLSTASIPTYTSISGDLQEIVNGSIKVCINSVDLLSSKAMLEVIPSGSQDGIVTHFDDGAKETYGC